MTRAQARAALLEACRKVSENETDLAVWDLEWERMLKVQKEYSGVLDLEPLLMMRPGGLGLDNPGPQ